MQKKTVLFHSNYAGAKTGFGGFMREILSYLYGTGKYNLVLYAAGMTWEHKDFSRWPWKTYGTLPTDPKDIQTINQDPNLARGANYGEFLIDKIIQAVKPDVYVGVEDPWGIEFCSKKKWWGKIPCVVHTTLDSRPIHKPAIELSKTTPYFFSWADFATKEMKAMGLDNVETLRGTVNTKVYRRLSDSERLAIRERHGIPEKAFCFGMLSRNQLRKSFPNIIRAYVDFKKRNPQVKQSRLLFFTHFSEGWDIPKLLKEHGVKEEECLATYKCRQTGRYYIRPFKGQDLDNPETGAPKSLVTVNVQDGLTEEQVNEWYNILDVYVHAFTSGGQERSIQEAKLTELITLVTNYSCGEDSCNEEAGSLPLDWDEYREPGSQFIKATTKPYSIVKQLEKVLKMDEKKRRELGKKARQWVLDNFSIEVIGAKFEKLLDSFPVTDYDFKFNEVKGNPEAEIVAELDDSAWVKSLYREILHREVTDEDEGLVYWMSQLKNNAPRPPIEDYFRKVARDELSKAGSDEIQKLLGNEAAEDRVLICMPESLGDCLYLTALLKDARELYPTKKIYVATKPPYMDVFRALIGIYIDYVIAWRPEFDNSYFLEGACGQKKYFQIMLNAHFPTQRMINYLHNAEDKSAINLRYQ